MLHIIGSYSANRTTRAAPSPFRFSRMSSRHAFFQVSKCCRTHSYSDTLTSATHPVPPPDKRHTGGMKNKKADFTAGFP